jgi:hypothetical protein
MPLDDEKRNTRLFVTDFLSNVMVMSFWEYESPAAMSNFTTKANGSYSTSPSPFVDHDGVHI